MGAQTAPSQSDVSFEHQHMIREAFITFHSEDLVLIFGSTTQRPLLLFIPNHFQWVPNKVSLLY